MARPSRLTDAQVRDTCRRLLTAKENEVGAVEMLKLMLTFGELERAWGVSKIDRYRFEFPVQGGRIDLVLFHGDGGVSIVEVKAGRGLSEMAAGIGQLCMYSVLLPAALGSFSSKYINKILAAPIQPGQSASMAAACKMAGVRFALLPTFDFFRSEINSLGRWVCTHG